MELLERRRNKNVVAEPAVLGTLTGNADFSQQRIKKCTLKRALPVNLKNPTGNAGFSRHTSGNADFSRQKVHTQVCAPSSKAVPRWEHRLGTPTFGGRI